MRMIGALTTNNGIHQTMPAKFVRPLSMALLLSGLSLNAQADLNLNLGLTSEYIREGISQTDGNITWQAGATWHHGSGLYLGGWASGLDRNYARANDHANAEVDGFAGWYISLSKNIAIDMAATHYSFHGDSAVSKQDYNEYGARLLIDDSWSVGWRRAADYLGTDSDRDAIDFNYVLHTSTFDFDFYIANYRWLDADLPGAGYNDSGRDDYWHFRLGVERTWKNWDYRVTLERTNLGKAYDGGTLFQLGIHRYFNIF